MVAKNRCGRATTSIQRQAFQIRGGEPREIQLADDFAVLQTRCAVANQPRQSSPLLATQVRGLKLPKDSAGRVRVLESEPAGNLAMTLPAKLPKPGDVTMLGPLARQGGAESVVRTKNLMGLRHIGAKVHPVKIAVLHGHQAAMHRERECPQRVVDCQALPRILAHPRALQHRENKSPKPTRDNLRCRRPPKADLEIRPWGDMDTSRGQLKHHASERRFFDAQSAAGPMNGKRNTLEAGHKIESAPNDKSRRTS